MELLSYCDKISEGKKKKIGIKCEEQCPAGVTSLFFMEAFRSLLSQVSQEVLLNLYQGSHYKGRGKKLCFDWTTKYLRKCVICWCVFACDVVLKTNIKIWRAGSVCKQGTVISLVISWAYWATPSTRIYFPPSTAKEMLRLLLPPVTSRLLQILLIVFVYIPYSLLLRHSLTSRFILHSAIMVLHDNRSLCMSYLAKAHAPC